MTETKRCSKRREIRAFEEFSPDLLQDPEVEEIEDRALVESGFLRRLCDQIGDDQEPTENWREVLRSL